MATTSFKDRFWREKIDVLRAGDYDIATRAIVLRVEDAQARKHYCLETDSVAGFERGFGGNAFTFTVLNGQFAGLNIRSNNTWYQGEIPEKYYNELPVNAKMLSIAEIEQILRDGGKFVRYNVVRGRDVSECFVDCTNEMRQIYRIDMRETRTDI